MKITYKHILIVLAGYLAYYIYQNIKFVNTPVKKTLIEKVVTSDRYGEPHYHYKWRLENGIIEYKEHAFYGSKSYEIGKTYIFNEQKITFK